MTCLLLVGANGPASAAPDPTFPVAGSVMGLTPGGSAPLVVSITNPFGVPIVVQHVGAVASDATPLCTTDFLVIDDTRGELLIPSGATATATLVATLTPSAPNACQDAAFPLSYEGHAVDAPTATTPHQASTAFAFTGTSAIPPVVAGLILLVVGTAIVTANRGRRAPIEANR